MEADSRNRPKRRGDEAHGRAPPEFCDYGHSGGPDSEATSEAVAAAKRGTRRAAGGADKAGRGATSACGGADGASLRRAAGEPGKAHWYGQCGRTGAQTRRGRSGLRRSSRAGGSTPSRR